MVSPSLRLSCDWTACATTLDGLGDNTLSLGMGDNTRAENNYATIADPIGDPQGACETCENKKIDSTQGSSLNNNPHANKALFYNMPAATTKQLPNFLFQRASA